MTAELESLAALVRSMPSPRPKPLLVCAPDVWEEIKRVAVDRDPPVVIEGNAGIVDVVVTAWAPAGWWKVFEGEQANHLRGGNITSLMTRGVWSGG
jgi:hypothetical protein